MVSCEVGSPETVVTAKPHRPRWTEPSCAAQRGPDVVSRETPPLVATIGLAANANGIDHDRANVPIAPSTPPRRFT